jgi:hypothetical protein
LKLSAILHDLTWLIELSEYTMIADGLYATASTKTDLFEDPFGKCSSANAAALLFDAPEHVQLSTRVSVDFRDTFDAGVLCIWQNETSWAKLCFEYSPEHEPMVVSVVTKGTSDDCNSRLVAGHTTFLRVSKMGEVFAFHASVDGQRWDMIRVFRLEPGTSKAGFLVQAPMGQGCDVQFDQIRYSNTRLEDVRSGV